MAHQQAAQGPPPDPKMQTEQMKAQLHARQAQMDAQIQAGHTQQELQADMVRSTHEAKLQVATSQAQHALDQSAEERKLLRDIFRQTGNGQEGT
jgi:hypothetical protein